MQKNDDQIQKKVAAYLRVSTEEQVEKYGIDLQRDAIEGLLRSKGKLDDGSEKFLLVKEYKDEGISGTTETNERPGFSQLMEDLTLSEVKPFDVVAVYKIDRFARRLKVLLEVIDLFKEHDVELLSANESIDTSTPFGNAMLGIIGVIAELEIETTKVRTRDGRLQAIKGGVAMGGHATFGYKKDIEKKPQPFEPEKKIVNLIFQKFVHENYSVQQIADYLTKHEYLSPDASAIYYQKRAGSPKKKNKMTFWRAEKVKSILQNEFYIGKYYFNKYKAGKRLPKAEWELSPYEHTPLVDNYVFGLAQLRLKEKGQYADSRRIKSKNKHIYLLSGLLRCGSCRETTLLAKLPTWVGDRKKVKSTGKYSYYYKCGNRNTRKTSTHCFVLPLPADPIEQYIVDYVLKLLRDPVAVFDYQMRLKSTQLRLSQLRSSRNRVTVILNGLPEQIERVKEQHQLDIISTDELKAKLKGLEDKKKTLSFELKNIDMQIGQDAISEQYITSLELFSDKYAKKLENIAGNREEICEVLHMLIDGIVVHSRRPGPEEKIPGRKSVKSKALLKEIENLPKMKLRKADKKFGPREDVRMPFEIDIYLKLPQQIMNQMVQKHVLRNEEFGANSDAL